MPHKPKTFTVDQRIDAFVEKINALPREWASDTDIPPSLRLGSSEGGWRYDWRIQKRDDIDWIEALEANLPGPLSPSFRSLVTRYVYPAFSVGGLWLFANTREQASNDWRIWLWQDKYLSRGLLTNGCIQFARPDTGSYDPICFDTRNRAKDGECPIVRIDHEGILCDDRLVIISQVAPSFSDFVEDYLAERSS
jgi:hypothetical protein